MLTLFVCNDMEEAWIASICAQQEREMAQWEIDEDLDHEEQLAREAVEDDETESWPWYADVPLEVVEPEEIDGEELSCTTSIERTCATCLDPIDADDECSCIGPGWETP